MPTSTRGSIALVAGVLALTGVGVAVLDSGPAPSSMADNARRGLEHRSCAALERSSDGPSAVTLADDLVDALEGTGASVRTIEGEDDFYHPTRLVEVTSRSGSVFAVVRVDCEDSQVSATVNFSHYAQAPYLDDVNFTTVFFMDPVLTRDVVHYDGARQVGHAYDDRRGGSLMTAEEAGAKLRQEFRLLEQQAESRDPGLECEFQKVEDSWILHNTVLSNEDRDPALTSVEGRDCTQQA